MGQSPRDPAAGPSLSWRGLVIFFLLTGLVPGVSRAASPGAQPKSTASEDAQIEEPESSPAPQKNSLEAKPKPRPLTHKERVFAEPQEAGDLVPAKVRRYAQRLLQRYDRNGDGRLQPEEWRQMPAGAQLADLDRDQVITVDELVQGIVAYGEFRRIRLPHPGFGPDRLAGPGQKPPAGAKAAAATQPSDDADKPLDPEALEAMRREAKFHVRASRLPSGLPNWFAARDDDGDGQLTLSEFAPKPTPAELEEFRRYDLNGDGMLTAKECVRAMKSAKSSGKK